MSFLRLNHHLSAVGVTRKEGEVAIAMTMLSGGSQSEGGYVAIYVDVRSKNCHYVIRVRQVHKTMGTYVCICVSGLLVRIPHSVTLFLYLTYVPTILII